MNYLTNNYCYASQNQLDTRTYLISNFSWNYNQIRMISSQKNILHSILGNFVKYQSNHVIPEGAVLRLYNPLAYT